LRAHSGLAVIALGLAATTVASHAASVLQVRAGTGKAATLTAANDYPFLEERTAITLDGVLETTGAGTLTFEYLGHEAGWTSTFQVGGEECFVTGRSEVGATCSVASSGGIVDFQLRAGTDAETGVTMWSNRAPPPAAWRHGIGLVHEGPNTFLILWNCGRGDGYDDLGVRVVFEPETRRLSREKVAVMLAGVIGAAGVRPTPHARVLLDAGLAVAGVRGKRGPGRPGFLPQRVSR
jgi:hypothetical protein